MTKSLQQCPKDTTQCEIDNLDFEIEKPGTVFHETEKISELKKKWLKLLKRKDIRQPRPSHRVCSKHFVKGKENILRGQRKCCCERYVEKVQLSTFRLERFVYL